MQQLNFEKSKNESFHDYLRFSIHSVDKNAYNDGDNRFSIHGVDKNAYNDEDNTFKTS